MANDDAATIAALCLRFVLADDRIDRVVIGTESKSQLEANVMAIGNTDTIPAVPDELLAELAIDDLSILNPSRWK
jgi:aryl-alcohol dehydrogenase-like predicted oxidoreductase